MSDSTTVNNQARPSMAAPLVLGAAGVGLGLINGTNVFVKSDYRGADKLVQLDKDVFEQTVAVNKDKLSDDGKAAYAKLETARAEYANGRNDLLTFLEDKSTGLGIEAETNYKPEGVGKTISELEGEVTKAIENNDAVKAAQKAVNDLAADATATPEAKTAAQNALDAAKKAAEAEDAAVQTAKKAVLDGKAERFAKIKKAITDGSNDALKKELENAENIMQKINEGTLKDFNWKNIKKILPKAKGLGAVVYAAIGLVVGSIIARAVANKKNMA